MDSDKKKPKISEIVFRVAAILLLAFYFYKLVFLHFNQAYYPVTGEYESDLFAHIEMALDGWGYSIMAVVFRLFSLLPETAFYVMIALFLSVCEIGAIVLTYIWLKKQEIKEEEAILLSIILGFVMPLFVVWIQPYRYAGYQSPSIWHNSTYIVMKVFSLLCICLYLGISEKYKDNVKPSSLILFSILLALTTSVKTSFILAFAPAAIIFLLLDMYLKVPPKRILLCALTVIPSLGVMLFQKYVLFGTDTGNSIIFDPLYVVYIRTDKPYFTMILSAAFPVLVFLYNAIKVFAETFKDIKKRESLRHRAFLFSWTMWFFAFLMLILLRESGERELDDNFAWGYDFALFLVFVVSVVYFVNNVRKLNSLLDLKKYAEQANKNADDKKGTKKLSVINTTLTVLYIEAATGALLYHLYCGVYFFIRLTKGATFFMY